MSQWIIRYNGRVVPCPTATPLTTAQLNSLTEKKKCYLFDKLISKRWVTSFLPLVLSPESNPDNDPLDPYEDDDEPACAIPKFLHPVDETDQLIDQQPAYDLLIHSKISLYKHDRLQSAKFLCQSLDPSGCSVDAYHKNPIINTLVYDVEFPDGEVKKYSANIIAKKLLAQVDDEGFKLTVFDSIIDHAKDDSLVEKKIIFEQDPGPDACVRLHVAGSFW